MNINFCVLRIVKLWRAYFIENRKNMLIWATLYFVLLAYSGYVSNAIAGSGTNYWENVSGFNGFLFIILFITATIHSINIYRQKHLAPYAIYIPATMTEKFVAAFVYSLAIVPLVYVLFNMVVASVINVILYFVDSRTVDFGLVSFFDSSILGLHSIAFLSAILFKKRYLLGMILIIAILFVVDSVIVNDAIFDFQKGMNDAMNNANNDVNITKTVVSDEFGTSTKIEVSGSSLIDTFWDYISIPLLWIISYVFFRRKQIK